MLAMQTSIVRVKGCIPRQFKSIEPVIPILRTCVWSTLESRLILLKVNVFVCVLAAYCLCCMVMPAA